MIVLCDSAYAVCIDFAVEIQKVTVRGVKKLNPGFEVKRKSDAI